MRIRVLSLCSIVVVSIFGLMTFQGTASTPQMYHFRTVAVLKPTKSLLTQALMTPQTTTTTSRTPTTTSAPSPSTPPTQPQTTATCSYSGVSPATAMSNCAVWACILYHESRGNYNDNTGNGYFGGFQFLASTWDHAATGAGYPQYANDRPDLAPPAVQDAVAQYWQSIAGWGQWGTAPLCL